MNSLLASNAKTQQTERQISELEQKYGISQAETEQPRKLGKSQPKITREEYEVIESVFKRLGCDSLITYEDFFQSFIGISYARFFMYQPIAIKAILTQARSETIEYKQNDLLKFVDTLKEVNDTMYRIVESSNIFEEAEVLCDALHEAKSEYK